MRRARDERGGNRGLLPAALLTLALAGCGESTPEYPSTLSFPSRGDRLVLKLPVTPPTGMNTAGQRDEEIARLDAVGGKTADPAGVSNDSRQALNRFLKDAFGTPAAPKFGGDPEASAAAGRLELAAEQLAEGGKLFRRHCQQCHNLAGDGRGPAGVGVVPFPRDFRRGEFKFTTTGTAKPRRSDILRTLAEGLKGTAMPSFGLLPEPERDLMARYAIYLSVRGEVEYRTLASALDRTPDMPAVAATHQKAILGEWEKAENAPPLAGLSIEPDDGEPGTTAHAAAVRRGYQLFTAKVENSCVTCHAEFGRKPVYRYDVWGTVAKPADLTAGTFKAGSRPQDVFARVRGGIPAVGMPAHPEYTNRQVWDLVRFVRSIPNANDLPVDLRAAVYPNP